MMIELFLLQPPLLAADFYCCLVPVPVLIPLNTLLIESNLYVSLFRPRAPSRLRVRYRLRTTGYRLQATGYKLQASLQTAGRASTIQRQHVRYLVPQYHTCTRLSDGVDFLLLRHLQFFSPLPFSSQFTFRVGYSTRRPRFVSMVITDSILSIYPRSLFTKPSMRCNPSVPADIDSILLTWSWCSPFEPFSKSSSCVILHHLSSIVKFLFWRLRRKVCDRYDDELMIDSW